ncbi:MAG: DsbE family thiol:disulfide interchange protein [Caldimonas sp.]
MGSSGARPSVAEGGVGEGAILPAGAGRRHAVARLWFLIPLAAFFALAVVLAVGLKLDPREVPSPLIDKPAPKFALARLDDASRTVRLDDLRGKAFLLNVWASWCAACREEHPLLVEFAKKRVVPVYGLNYKDTRPNASAWLARFGNPYDASFFDEDGRVGIDYGVYGVPETFVVDGNGVIRMKHIGPLTPDVLVNKIEPLLKKLDA